MKNPLKWKLVVRINGEKVDRIMCSSKMEAAQVIVNVVVRHGLEVYSIKNIRNVEFSISKVKK